MRSLLWLLGEEPGHLVAVSTYAVNAKLKHMAKYHSHPDVRVRLTTIARDTIAADIWYQKTI